MSQLKLRFVPGSDNRPQSVQEKKIQTETLPEPQEWLADIEELPARLRAAVAGLTEAQLDTPYRPGGWTVRQVVHHLADSHMNSYVRTRHRGRAPRATGFSGMSFLHDQQRWVRSSRS